MTIREDISVLHTLKADHKTSPTALTAINDGISALMTIEDMSFYGIPPVKKEPATAGFDMKILYEQTTMYCDIITTTENEDCNIEIYQQPNTPIRVCVYWSKKLHKITAITYTIQGE